MFQNSGNKKKCFLQVICPFFFFINQIVQYRNFFFKKRHRSFNNFVPPLQKLFYLKSTIINIMFYIKCNETISPNFHKCCQIDQSTELNIIYDSINKNNLSKIIPLKNLVIQILSSFIRSVAQAEIFNSLKVQNYFFQCGKSIEIDDTTARSGRSQPLLDWIVGVASG